MILIQTQPIMCFRVVRYSSTSYPTFKKRLRRNPLRLHLTTSNRYVLTASLFHHWHYSFIISWRRELVMLEVMIFSLSVACNLNLAQQTRPTTTSKPRRSIITQSPGGSTSCTQEMKMQPRGHQNFKCYTGSIFANKGWALTPPPYSWEKHT